MATTSFFSLVLFSASSTEHRTSRSRTRTHTMKWVWCAIMACLWPKKFNFCLLILVLLALPLLLLFLWCVRSIRVHNSHCMSCDCFGPLMMMTITRTRTRLCVSTFYSFNFSLPPVPISLCCYCGSHMASSAADRMPSAVILFCFAFIFHVLVFRFVLRFLPFAFVCQPQIIKFYLHIICLVAVKSSQWMIIKKRRWYLLRASNLSLSPLTLFMFAVRSKLMCSAPSWPTIAHTTKKKCQQLCRTKWIGACGSQ